MVQDRKAIVTPAGLMGLQVGRREQVSVGIEYFEDCQNESPGWVWLALVPRERIGGLLFRGWDDKRPFSSRQFGNPLMYCGVSIHATWTASSEGPAGVGTGLAEGVPPEGVLQNGDL